jgi:hypothetical protein
MEKIILAIIALNIIISLIARNRKKKRLQQAAEAQSRNKEEKRDVIKKKMGYKEELAQLKPEKPKLPASPVVNKSLNTGKNILDQVARELGLEFPEEREAPEQEYVIETVVPEFAPPPPVRPEKSESRKWDQFSSHRERTMPAKPVFPETDSQPVKKSLILDYLKERESFKRAFILKTILDPPLALRGRRAFIKR